MMIRAAIAILLFATAPAFAEVPLPEPVTGFEAKPTSNADTSMVAAANPLAVEAGVEILDAGGSAADAIIAVQLVLNLVEPQSSGIGGGAFLVWYDAGTGKLATLDGRETAPMAAGPDLFLGPDGQPLEFYEAVTGGRSVGTPGTLALLHAIHVTEGKLPWARLFEPAIRLAEDGFEVSPRLEAAIASAAAHGFGRQKAARALFFDEDGHPLKAGTIFRNKAFARTLRTIAKEGPRAFYEGPIADEIVAAVAADPNPGLLAREDLAAYEAKSRPPVCVEYRKYQICGMGPPSSGGITVAETMKLLERFDLAAAEKSLTAHIFAEASRLAFADRDRWIADEDFVPVPTDGLLAQDYLARRSRLIDPAKAMAGKAEAGTPPGADGQRGIDDKNERPGTSHISIVDADGNMASMTTTIETGFGSRMVVGGFVLNNELTDFSFAPEQDGKPVANRVEGGKRPRSSMAPTIVYEKGRPVLAIGSPGGSRIIPYVAWALVQILDKGVPIGAALAAGHVSNRNGVTELEGGTEAATLAPPLKALGHEVRIIEMNSGLHAVMIEPNGQIVGAADPRREGTALGR